MKRSGKYGLRFDPSSIRRRDPEGSIVWEAAKAILYIAVVLAVLGFFLHKIAASDHWTALPF